MIEPKTVLASERGKTSLGASSSNCRIATYTVGDLYPDFKSVQVKNSNSKHKLKIETIAGSSFDVSMFQTVCVVNEGSNLRKQLTTDHIEIMPSLFLSVGMNLAVVNVSGQIMADPIKTLVMEFESDNSHFFEIQTEDPETCFPIIFNGGLGILIGPDQSYFFEPLQL